MLIKKFIPIFTLLLISLPITCSIVPEAIPELKTDNLQANITLTVTPKNQHPQQKDWKGFLTKEIPSLCIACTIGALNGAICAKLENKRILPRFFSWILFWGTRRTAIELVSQDMKTYGIAHNKELSHIAAWLTEWITYLIL